MCRLVLKARSAPSSGGSVEEAKIGAEGGGGGGGLNFYSCADDTAIFRSIKGALKLSGQFRR